MTHPAISRAWSTASNLGAAAVMAVDRAAATTIYAARGVSNAARSVVVAPPDRQPPEGFPVLLARTLEQTFPDGPPPGVVPYVTGRLAREGYDADLFNAGGLRCLCAHDHAAAAAAGDDRCAPRKLAGGSVVFLRRYPSQEEGLRRLLTVAFYRTSAATPTPSCPWCGEHDAEREVVTSSCARVAPEASVAGIGDDITSAKSSLSAAWTVCKLCHSLGANLGAAEDVGAEDVGVAVVEDAESAGVEHVDDDVSGLGLAVLGIVAVTVAIFGSYAAWAIVKLRGVAERLSALGLRIAAQGEPVPAGWVAITSSDPLWNQARAAFRDEGAWTKFAMGESGLKLIHQAAGATPEARAVNAAMAKTGVKDKTSGAEDYTVVAEGDEVGYAVLVPEEGGVAGYHSRDPNATEAPPPDVAGELPDLGDDEVAGVEVAGVADPIVDRTLNGTLAELADAWSKVIATRDASPPDCACRQATGPLIAEWTHYRDGEGAAEGEGFARQWANLRRAQAAQSSAALLPPEASDFTVDVRSEEEWAANPRPGAVNVPIRDEEGGGGLVARVAEVAPPKESARLVVFCKSGVRAGRACTLLSGAGWHACNGHEESCPIPGLAAGDVAVADPGTGWAWGENGSPVVVGPGRVRGSTDEEHAARVQEPQAGDGIVVVEIEDSNVGADPGRIAAAVFTGGASEGALAAKHAADNHNAAQRRRHDARERKVQEFLAAHDHARERARRDAAAAARYAPTATRWQQTIATYADPDTTDDADLTTAADDLGAFAWADHLGSIDPNTLNPEMAAKDPAVALLVIGERWEQLLKWLGASASVPEIKGQIDAWQTFKKEHVETTPSASWLIPGYGPYKAYKALTTDASKGDGAIRGQASDLAVAEGNAAKHGYVVPKLSIDADGKVTRTDVGQKTGADSPGPTTPSVAGKTGPNIVVAPPPTPSVETLHPIAVAVDAAADDAKKKAAEAASSPWPWVGAGVVALAIGKLAIKAAVGAVVEDDA